MRKDRVIVGSSLILALLGAVFLLPPLAMLVIIMIICAVALLEFYALLDAAQISHFKLYGLAGGLVLMVGTWYSVGTNTPFARDVELALLAAFVGVVFARQFFQKGNPKPWETMAGTILGVMYIPFMLNFFTRLFLTWGEGHGRIIALYLILVVKAADVGAYYVGCSIGKHKLIPRISPAKTWEGFWGGILTGTLVSLAYALICRNTFSAVNLSVVDSVVLGLLLSVVGTAGDLAESLFKRAAGVKDSGRMFLGMGGLLDVIDSLIFAAPALYIYMSLLGA
jgi:phosphatidate cytidylyltransferase